MNNKFIIILLFLASLVGHAPAQCNADSLLYKLVLLTDWKEEYGKKSKYLTIDYRPGFPYLLGVKLDEWNVDSLTFKQLIQISDTLSIACHTAHLTKMYQNDPEVKILTEDSYRKQKFTAKKFWKRFWKVYPESSGQTFVSAIGYNADCTEAVFYFEIVSQWLVGGGWFAVCRFNGDEWMVEKIIPVLQM